MKRLMILLMGLFAIVGGSHAQTGGEAHAIAILFYSPSCPHCHTYIQNELPQLQAEWGDQLSVYLVDVTTPEGGYLAGQAFAHHGVPQGSWGVPMMLIGEHILQGGAEIPANASTHIAAGLADGGIGAPPIPAIEQVLRDVVPPAAGDTASGAAATVPAELSIAEKLARDPVANALAVVVLVALVLSIVLVVFQIKLPLVRTLMGGGSLVFAIGLAALLLVQSERDSLALALIVTTFILLVSALIIGGVTRSTALFVPLLALAGLAVAYYLAVIELTHDAAACGLVGDCNTVQQSPYAYLFGVIPIGVLGVGGYFAILGAYVAKRLGVPGAERALRGGLLFGVTFSIYLTFLEPFVIGATCLWCLLSATLMLALLWIAESERVPAAATTTQPDEGLIADPLGA